ncbi:MAG: 4'-phosphopantetheinyl transferase superfamily protein [Terriglobales bacterium]
MANLAENASFNLSHTRGLAMLAIARNRVGIDAEAVCSDIDIEDLSRRFFAPAETEEILGLSSDARIAAFFACWTRKEAIIKALGAGLSMPLDSFQVTVRADQPARLVSASWGDPNHWSLIDIGEPGIAATLAVEGSTPLLRRFNFVPPPA